MPGVPGSSVLFFLMDFKLEARTSSLKVDLFHPEVSQGGLGKNFNKWPLIYEAKDMASFGPGGAPQTRNEKWGCLSCRPL